MKTTSSLWVGALWQAAMPMAQEEQSSSTTAKVAEPSTSVTQQAQQTINPA
ncbi:hypothetical protein [Shewanella phaeophyticola]|uniref:Uncharacterized protein n=1 Tax=Shewanella phaeophyticola TaxID=2978345 RepID=A0ABT2P0X9_9GAMM|nr:hypothetical protein [Shewanella sp. KJ10-1]MCT8985325.1 hypothetical protein [Shewanella sp. KJ10-1]